MKKLYTFVFIFFFAVTLKAQSYETSTDYKGVKTFTGFITDSLLKTDSSCTWFGEAQKVYEPKDKVVKAFAAAKDSVSFIVFMGTWCGDSHFVVPRFLKILDKSGFSKDKLTIMAVDRTKKDKQHLAATFGITNVPTIIAFKDGKEIGRTIEYGSTGKFDEELAEIIAK
ncbi:MAG: thioredoxin family protein [Niabella sp.]